MKLRKSTLREASYIPQPLLLRTVSDLRVPYALQPASNGLLPFWEKGLGDEGKTYKSGMHSVTSCPAGVGKIEPCQANPCPSSEVEFCLRETSRFWAGPGIEQPICNACQKSIQRAKTGWLQNFTL